jgi:lauroyl/myristoyl acyltransferase
MEWLAVKGAGSLVPLLSRRACSRLARSLSRLAFRLDARNRRVAISNLEAAGL